MNRNPYFAWGAEATLRSVRKRIYSAYPTVVVQDTAELVVLYLPAGAAGKDFLIKPTPEERLYPDKLNIADREWDRTDVLMLTFLADAFSVLVMWETRTPNLACWYINLQEPLQRTRIGFDTSDHILDIVVSPDMSEWQWKDEIELADAEKLRLYSADEVRRIRQAGEKAIQLMLTERRAFYQGWEKWRAPDGWRIPQLSQDWDKLD